MKKMSYRQSLEYNRALREYLEEIGVPIKRPEDDGKPWSNDWYNYMMEIFFVGYHVKVLMKQMRRGIEGVGTNIRKACIRDERYDKYDPQWWRRDRTDDPFNDRDFYLWTHFINDGARPRGAFLNWNWAAALSMRPACQIEEACRKGAGRYYKRECDSVLIPDWVVKPTTPDGLAHWIRTAFQYKAVKLLHSKRTH